MSRRKAFLLKTLLFLFALNSISLYIYFSPHPDHFHPKPQSENPKFLTEDRKSLTDTHQRHLVPVSFHVKPWPILPSYLPWSLNPNVRAKSCEGYFGNGFNRRIDLLRSLPETFRRSPNYGGAGGGWFRCLYSETLDSSICEGGRIRMNPDKIRMSVGGEKLESVMGRREEEELPSFDSSAFEIEVAEGSTEGGGGRKLVNEEFLDRFVPQGAVQIHTMRSLLDSIRLVPPDEFNCSEWVEEPTLLVTRFEYANLFHTVTDWYSAYVASRVTGLPNRPHLVFVDGHCETHLEETWKALFSSLRYAKNFSGSVCFRHAILSPLGYETALFKGLTENIDCGGAAAHDLWQKPDDRKTARLSEFGEMLRAAFGFPVDRNRMSKTVSRHNVLFVRREDYLAHPRHGGRLESRLSNEQEVFESVKFWAVNHMECKVNLINGLLAHMSMKEQVRAIQDASVIIGAHGAGLTHIIAARPTTVILEIISSQFRRPHFSLISQWRGLEYYAINLAGSHAEPAVVIEKLNNIMRNLGC
ncbi:PREDICTED: beta-(1,2)-xylosyltransferase [Nelumbo nucifera]|uniref:Beta-(1,2)-xylosyltransferase n=1 Tax=Nelumbo nucifera TaxID=4432 RepID=A0A1U8B2D2_NELNU|nr:PREDICTED: beta-(1,2)-xylosyltransferase [Nelumbo nucifera]